MRSMITWLAVALLLCCTTQTQADDAVLSDQVLAQMGLNDLEQISDTEGEAIRGKAFPSLALSLENLVVVDLTITRSTIVFVQNELAIDLNVLIGNKLNLAIGSIGN